MSTAGQPAQGTAVTCQQCDTPTDPLDLFPGGVCLTCWRASPEGRRMVTAGELVAMWGGPVQRRAR